MKVYIARHYWKDGENATWESHEKIDKELFSYLKKNYHVFTEKKEPMIKKDKQFVYLFYEDETDAFGRNITNITFFVSKKKLELKQKPSKSEYDDLEYEVQDRDLLIKIMLIFVGIIVLIDSFYFNKESSSNVVPTSNAQSSYQNDLNKTKTNLEENNKTKEIVSPKVNKENSTKNSEKEKKIKERKEQNIQIKTSIKDAPTRIHSEEDFNNIYKIVTDIKPKQKILDTDNNETFIKLETLFNEYRKCLTDGIKVRVTLLEEDIKIRKLKIFRNNIVRENDYEINTTIKKDLDWIKSLKWMNNWDGKIELSVKITKNNLIKLYNEGSIEIKIDKNYSIRIEGIEGDTNATK